MQISTNYMFWENQLFKFQTFFLISVSVSVPADLELTGESVPSTESSLKNFKGEWGEGWWWCEYCCEVGIPILAVVVCCVVFRVIGVEVAISDMTSDLLYLIIKSWRIINIQERYAFVERLNMFIRNEHLYLLRRIVGFILNMAVLNIPVLDWIWMISVF